MPPFDSQSASFDPAAFSPLLRALSLALSAAVIGAIVFQTASTAAAVV